jgi:Calx-beta domain
MCGIGDEGCEIKIPDNFNPVLTPKTVTIPANTNSIKINVQQFSYTGGHGGETYNEGWFIKLQNPSGAILGRSVGTGLLLPDVEGTPAVLPYLYTGSAAVVPTTDAGGEPLYFAVTLGSVETSTVTFDYATSDGSAFAGTDYTAASGTASIPAGKTSAIIPITLLPNSPPGTNRSFTLTISNASGGSGLLISRPTGTGTILAS